MNTIAVFIIAILAGMGIGSGGLLVIYLTLILDFPQRAAQTNNLLFFLISGVSSLFLHIKKRNIPIKPLLTLIFSGLFGSIAGTFISSLSGEGLLRVLFGILLLIAGGLTLCKSVLNVKNAKKGKKTEEK